MRITSLSSSGLGCLPLSHMHNPFPELSQNFVNVCLEARPRKPVTPGCLGCLVWSHETTMFLKWPTQINSFLLTALTILWVFQLAGTPDRNLQVLCLIYVYCSLFNLLSSFWNMWSIDLCHCFLPVLNETQWHLWPYCSLRRAAKLNLFRQDRLALKDSVCSYVLLDSTGCSVISPPSSCWNWILQLLYCHCLCQDRGPHFSSNWVPVDPTGCSCFRRWFTWSLGSHLYLGWFFSDFSVHFSSLPKLKRYMFSYLMFFSPNYQ